MRSSPFVRRPNRRPMHLPSDDLERAQSPRHLALQPTSCGTGSFSRRRTDKLAAVMERQVGQSLAVLAGNLHVRGRPAIPFHAPFTVLLYPGNAFGITYV